MKEDTSIPDSVGEGDSNEVDRGDSGARAGVQPIGNFKCSHCEQPCDSLFPNPKYSPLSAIDKGNSELICEFCLMQKQMNRWRIVLPVPEHLPRDSVAKLLIKKGIVPESLELVDDS